MTPSGLVVGGQGGPEDELLVSGQEEVFSRTEVEEGAIEHHVEAGDRGEDGALQTPPEPARVRENDG